MKNKRTNTYSIYKQLWVPLMVLMLLYSLFRITFTALNHSLFPTLSIKSFEYMLLGGLKFDVVAILYLNILYILALSIPFPFKYRSSYQRVCKIIFLITNTLGIVSNFVDFVYYPFTLKRTTATIFKQFKTEQNKSKLAFNFLIDYWYLLIALIVIIVLIYKLIHRYKAKYPIHFKVKDYLIQTLIFVLTIGVFIVGVRGGWKHSTRPITLSNAGEFVDQPEEMNIVLNTPFCILKTLEIQDLKEIHDFDEQTLAKIYNPHHLGKPDSVFKKENVVLLIIESLGKEHVGSLNQDLLHGTYKGFTPNLDSIINKSYTFRFSFANGRKSIDALPSVISSIPSIKEPFVLTNYAGNHLPSLAYTLKNEGYTTAFFHGADNGSMGFSSFTKLTGIDHYYGKNEYNNDTDYDGIWGIWDEPFMQFMANKINTFKSPFFSAFFSVSSHHPFKVPEKYKGKFPKGHLPVQEPMGYTDMAIGEFFKTASKMPWYKNTLFVICADHATVSYLPEYQNEVGYYSIPIIFYRPGNPLVGKSEQSIQQIDIMPTVLGLLNYPKPYFSFGFDALDSTEKDQRFVINNNGSSYNLYKGDYLLMANDHESTALYTFKTDRLLKNNLIGKLPDVQNIMETKLKAFIQQYNNRMIRNELK